MKISWYEWRQETGWSSPRKNDEFFCHNILIGILGAHCEKSWVREQQKTHLCRFVTCGTFKLWTLNFFFIRKKGTFFIIHLGVWKKRCSLDVPANVYTIWAWKKNFFCYFIKWIISFCEFFYEKGKKLPMHGKTASGCLIKLQCQKFLLREKGF